MFDWYSHANAALGQHAVYPNVSALLRDQAIAAVGFGADHTIGENLVAVVEKESNHGFFSGALLTDRFLGWRTGQYRGDLAWRSLAGLVVESGLVTARSEFRLLDGRTGQAPHLPALARLAAAVCAVHPDWRSPQDRPLPATTLEARRTALFQDAKAAALADVADAVGAPAEPIALLHRTHAFGRGKSRDGWLSPLAPADLVGAMVRVLGAPLSHRTDPDGMVIADIAVPDSFAHASTIARQPIETVAVKSARNTLERLGIGRAIRHVRVAAAASGAFSAFAVHGVEQGQAAPLQQQNSKLLGLIHAALVPVEAWLLLARMALGKDVPSPHLLTVGFDAVRARLPSIDLRAFATSWGA